MNPTTQKLKNITITPAQKNAYLVCIEKDFPSILKEDENFENIIIDTKGGINEDLITILPTSTPAG